MRSRAAAFGPLGELGARLACREESAMKAKVIREHKAAATTAGVLYITGTVAGVLSVVLIAPVRGGSCQAG